MWMQYAVFDVATRQLEVPNLGALSYGCRLFGIARTHGAEVPVSGLAFGVVGSIAGSALSFWFPPSGMTVKQIGSGVPEVALADLVLRWRPDDDVSLTITLQTATDTHERALSFTAPRPAQPYPSWLWDSAGRGWVAPVPYPSIGGPYEWSEDAGGWRGA